MAPSKVGEEQCGGCLNSNRAATRPLGGGLFAIVPQASFVGPLDPLGCINSDMVCYSWVQLRDSGLYPLPNDLLGSEVRGLMDA